jgi:hypothetical protein
MAAAKPVILPDTFSGTEGSWDHWIAHFRDCATINSWDNAAMLAFLRVRLVGRTRVVFQRLPAERTDTFDHVIEALKERFEPASKLDLYVADFSMRKCKPSESWADYAEELHHLAIKAYPDLATNAVEQFALTQFLANLADRQVSFAVKQKLPRILDEAVMAAMQIEAHLSTTRIATAESDQDSYMSLSAIQSREEKMTSLITDLCDKVERLESKLQTQSCAQQRQRSQRNPRIVCFNCQQRGHIARECTAPRQMASGNEKPSVM